MPENAHENETTIQREGNKIGIDFLTSIYGGFVNLVSDNASPKGNIGGGIDFTCQYFAKQDIGFIPKNYYMETSLGYSLKGCGQFPLHYIMLKISPIGYRYAISNYALFGNIGAYAGYTFSTIKTEKFSFDSNIDWGVLIKIGIERSRMGMAFSYERGFNDVCNSNLKLKNQGFFLNLSYRLLNLK